MMIYIDLKQSYCRDLRDCQTYFPCAVFSSGFSYLYVIKRCPNEQIFHEGKQKCVRNTMDDPACVKQIGQGKIRATKRPSASSRASKRKNKTNVRAKMPNLIKQKNFEVEPMEETITTTTATEFASVENNNNGVQRVCYVTNWSRYRTGEAKFEIEYIDPFMCSHIIYAYATVNDQKPEIIPVQKEDIEHYRELTLLKQRNPDLKLSIRLGGKSSQYTRHLKRSKSAKQLVRSLMWYMTTYGFDGVDVALEFSDEDVPEDKLALTTFLEVSIEETLRERDVEEIFLGNQQTKTIDCYANCGTIC